MKKSILVSFAVLFAAVVAVGCKRSPKNKEYVYDVYVAGYEGKAPMLWKNGEPTKLSHNGTDAIATAVFVSGNDVYAAGLECVYDNGQDQADPPRYVGVFWKNGIISRFTDLAGKADLEVKDLFVSGNDVYVVGFEERNSKKVAMLWTKRGESGRWETKDLTDGSKGAIASSVYVIDNHIYVTGSELKENSTIDIAMLWTKAADSDTWEVKKLTNGETDASARSVYVVKREK